MLLIITLGISCLMLNAAGTLDCVDVVKSNHVLRDLSGNDCKRDNRSSELNSARLTRLSFTILHLKGFHLGASICHASPGVGGKGYSWQCVHVHGAVGEGVSQNFYICTGIQEELISKAMGN